MKYFFLSIALVGFLFSQDFKEIDSNLENRNFEDVIIPLNKLNTEYPKNLDVLVRLSAAHHLLSEKTYDKKMDSYHLNKAMDYINEAIKSQIEGAKIIEFHSMEAIKKLPNDPYCYNVMGQWHYRLADLGKMSRGLAKIIFEEPPQGSFDIALDYFEKSIKLEPEYIGTYYWLGKTYQKLGRFNDTLAIFEKGIELSPPYKREEAFYQEMVKILKKNDRKKS